MKQLLFATIATLLLLPSCTRRAQHTCFCNDGYRGNTFSGNDKAAASASEQCKEYKQSMNIDTLECSTLKLD